MKHLTTKSPEIPAASQRTRVLHMKGHSSNSPFVSGLSLEWPLVSFVIGVPLLASINLIWVPIYKHTVLLMVIYAFLRGLCITAGKKIYQLNFRIEYYKAHRET
jgi:hypothetical protein